MSSSQSRLEKRDRAARMPNSMESKYSANFQYLFGTIFWTASGETVGRAEQLMSGINRASNRGTEPPPVKPCQSGTCPPWSWRTRIVRRYASIYAPSSTDPSRTSAPRISGAISVRRSETTSTARLLVFCFPASAHSSRHSPIRYPCQAGWMELPLLGLELITCHWQTSLTRITPRIPRNVARSRPSTG